MKYIIKPTIALIFIWIFSTWCKSGGHLDTNPVVDIQSISWPIFRGDRQLSGVAQDTLSDRLKRIWTFKTGDEVNASPVIGDGKVFVGSMDGKIYCLDLLTGTKNWEYNTKSLVEAPSLLLDGILYTGTEDSGLVALESATGKLKWKYKTDGKIIGSANWFPLSNENNLILFGCYDSKMHCVEAKTGKARWTYDTKNYINGGPAFYQNNVIFGGCDALLHRVSVLDGTTIAKIDVMSYAAASPSVCDYFAYVGNYNGQLMCIDLENKKIEWTYEDLEEGDAFFASPAISGNRLVIGSRDERVHCLNRITGKRIWTFRTQGEVDSSPVIAGEKVVFGSGDGRLYMIKLSDGSQIWSYEIGAGIYSSPAVAGGMVIIGAEDGNIYAFRSE